MKELILDFDCNDSQGLSLGKSSDILATALERSILTDRGAVVKYFDWALQLRKAQTIQVDDADFRKLNEFIDTTQYIITGGKYWIIKYFESVK